MANEGLGEQVLLERRPTGREVQGLELAVFLFLIVPSMILSFFVTRQGGVSFVPAAVMIIVRDLALVSLVLFFVWRNGEPLTHVGWVLKGRKRDILLALLESAGLSAPATPKPKFSGGPRPASGS